MRIWDIPPQRLCRKHLLAEHRELHAIWRIITLGKRGYSNHPETLRWKGKLKALYLRHEAQVREFRARGYLHLSPLDARLAKGKQRQDVLLASKKEQLMLLKKKGCGCPLR